MSKMNLPNKLTILRVVLVPVFIACMLYIPNIIVRNLVAGLVFAITATTDLLDGKIARKYNIVTNFGKFMDPLADKFMVFAALFIITETHSNPLVKQVMIWVSAIVFFRELAVTSIRLVCQGTGAGVIAASFFGKCKTVTQVAAIGILLAEPVVCEIFGISMLYIPSLIGAAAMTVMTVGSGLDYFKTYAPYLNSNK